jgi:hypothetical protein
MAGSISGAAKNISAWRRRMRVLSLERVLGALSHKRRRREAHVDAPPRGPAGLPA